MSGFGLLLHTPAPGRLGIDHELRTTSVRRGRTLAISETLASLSSPSTLPLARSVDQVNTSADGARHDLINAIRSLNAGVALHANARIGAAVYAVHEGRHTKGITTAAGCSDDGQ